ncbi:MAG: sugar phosphate isomerase/epimerase [Planctomycetes bacterium]|nr:sugar phosphate isomerase/epimerase [Planctomycetota bacterium]
MSPTAATSLQPITANAKPLATATGAFPILFRQWGTPWQTDVGQLIRYTSDHGFSGIDATSLPVADIGRIRAAGLRIGTVDVPFGDWGGLVSPDAAKRDRCADAVAAYVNAVVAATDVRNFFTVIMPEDAARSRDENMAFALAGFGRVGQLIAGSGARILFEGWPGSYPGYSSLGCTPADLRTIFRAIGTTQFGVNFDPSHLVRMGVDPVRFLEEFAPQVHHVHAKDTEIDGEALYDHGNLYDRHWRYTIPGHGVVRWSRLFQTLVKTGYTGCVSIELEDCVFMKTSELQQRGLAISRDFLAHA